MYDAIYAMLNTSHYNTGFNFKVDRLPQKSVTFTEAFFALTIYSATYRRR